MKNMYNRIILLLIVTMVAASIIGCSKDNVNSDVSTNNSTKTNTNTNSSSENNVEVSVEQFPKFTGEDLNGNKVTEELFKENAATVVNLWFTGCSPCINEMPDLEKLSNEWKEKGVQLVGICADIDESDESEEIKAEAKRILEAQGATYTNIYFNRGEESDKFMMNIMAFPTTFILDRDGNIIGDPILGTINNDESIKEINSRIDAIIANEGGPEEK